MTRIALALMVCAAWTAHANAQVPQAAPASLTLRDAVARAVEHYPAIRVATENLESAASGVDLSRTSYLPRTDIMWQANRATRNNVFGALLPQSVVPGISGPVGFDDASAAWGSAMGLSLMWEPFDFGVRGANVQSALMTERRAAATVDVTRLQVVTATADAFLAVVAAQQTLRTAEATVERARILRDVVEARVTAGLRPAVDAARARAELALAENQRLIAEQIFDTTRITLGRLIAVAPNTITVSPGPLLALPPDAEPRAPQPVASPQPQAPPVAAHPALLEQRAIVDEAGARLRALNLSWVPRVNLQGTTFARGSGAMANGGVLEGFSGLRPTVSNWAVGMTISFPIMERPALRARSEAEFHRQRAESARYDRLIEDLSGQLERAQRVLDATRLIARNTPFQLEAARAVEQQATARYQAGLASIVDVADAQRLLTHAEIDDSLARLNIWRGLLQVAVAEGNVDGFLNTVP